MMIVNFQPTHSEELSLPNAFNVDLLVSNWSALDVDDDLGDEIIMMILLMMIIMILLQKVSIGAFIDCEDFVDNIVGDGLDNDHNDCTNV